MTNKAKAENTRDIAMTIEGATDQQIFATIYIGDALMRLADAVESADGELANIVRQLRYVR